MKVRIHVQILTFDNLLVISFVVVKECKEIKNINVSILVIDDKKAVTVSCSACHLKTRWLS